MQLCSQWLFNYWDWTVLHTVSSLIACPKWKPDHQSTVYNTDNIPMLSDQPDWPSWAALCLGITLRAMSTFTILCILSKNEVILGFLARKIMSRSPDLTGRASGMSWPCWANEPPAHTSRCLWLKRTPGRPQRSCSLQLHRAEPWGTHLPHPPCWCSARCDCPASKRNCH